MSDLSKMHFTKLQVHTLSIIILESYNILGTFSQKKTCTSLKTVDTWHFVFSCVGSDFNEMCCGLRLLFFTHVSHITASIFHASKNVSVFMVCLFQINISMQVCCKVTSKPVRLFLIKGFEVDIGNLQQSRQMTEMSLSLSMFPDRRADP